MKKYKVKFETMQGKKFTLDIRERNKLEVIKTAKRISNKTGVQLVSIWEWNAESKTYKII